MSSSSTDTHHSSKSKEKSPLPERKPSKSILKKSSGSLNDKHKEASFDEMNILATYHPENKDYGHMQIDEPKTPYRNEDAPVLDINDVADRLAHTSDESHHASRRDSERSADFSDDDQSLSPEEREKRRLFKQHRKEHYNMKVQMKKAKELLAKELAELDDD